MLPVRTAGPAIYFTGLVMLAAGLPFWLLMMSIAQFFLLAGWLIDGNVKQKFLSALRNPALLAIAGVYIMHIAGMIYTEDINYGLADLRVKLPLFLIPFTVATMPLLTKGKFEMLLNVVIASTFISTLCSTFVWLGMTKIIVHDIRDISIFISHIRLALIICTVIVCCVYFVRQKAGFKWIYYFLICWFTVFIFILQSITGIIMLVLLGIFYSLYIIAESKSKIKTVAAGIYIIAVLSSSAYFFNMLFIESVKPLQITQAQLKNKTANGNSYIHNLKSHEIENGQPVWINICEEEMEREWNNRSSFRYKGTDASGQELRVTLIRYLTSKNYQKDAYGIAALTNPEIKAIENGIANAEFINNNSFRARFKKLAWEYRNYYYSGNPSGHSITQRIEFWKAALYIFKKHPVTGVGTGDVKKEFEKAYVEMHSELLPKFRLRAHNEYLTILLTFGIPGAIYFLFSLIYPFIRLRKKQDFLYCGFFVIMLLSMVAEDTPESQAGATFMAFFNSILLFHNYSRPLQ
jgi:hypothetical protein